MCNILDTKTSIMCKYHIKKNLILCHIGNIETLILCIGGAHATAPFSPTPHNPSYNHTTPHRSHRLSLICHSPVTARTTSFRSGQRPSHPG